MYSCSVHTHLHSSIALANGTLKQQNEDLQRMLVQARDQIQAIKSGQAPSLSSQLQQQQGQASAVPGGVGNDSQQQPHNVNDSPTPAVGHGGSINASSGDSQGALSAQASSAVASSNGKDGGSNSPVSSLDSSTLIANWMNIQAAMGGAAPGFLGFDPSNPYAQALNQVCSR